MSITSGMTMRQTHYTGLPLFFFKSVLHCNDSCSRQIISAVKASLSCSCIICILLFVRMSRFTLCPSSLICHLLLQIFSLLPVQKSSHYPHEVEDDVHCLRLRQRRRIRPHPDRNNDAFSVFKVIFSIDL